MRVMLDQKTILADGLTYEQATALMDAVRNRESLKPILADRVLWMQSGQNNKWSVYVIDDAMQKAFLKDPESFLFEV